MWHRAIRHQATHRGLAPHANVYAYTATPVTQPGYTLNSGDRLRVVVFGQRD